MKQIKKMIKEMTLGALFGVVIGVFISIVLLNKDIQFTQVSFLSQLMFLVCSFLFSIFIHELGHLVMGLLSGYRFASFRFLNFHFQKDNEGKYKLHMHHVPGTLGQCLMVPPEKENLSIFWYNFGGSLFNLLVSFLSILLVFVFQKPGVVLFFFWMMIINLFSCLQNWISFKGIYNDGSNYRVMKKNATSKKVFYYLLLFNHQLSEGILLRDLDIEAAEALGLDGSDQIQLNLMMVLITYYQFTFQSEKYEAILEMVYPIVKSGVNFMDMALQVEYYMMKLLLGYEDAKEYKTKALARMIERMVKVEGFVLVRILEKYVQTQSIDESLEKALSVLSEKSVTPGQSMSNRHYLEDLKRAISGFDSVRN